MARKTSGTQLSAVAARTRIEWFKTSDESVAAVADWDIKPEQLAYAILEVLQAGDAVMFGVSMAGDAISVTLYSGEQKQRKWVSDSIELDDLMLHILQAGRTRRGALRRGHLEAAAD